MTRQSSAETAPNPAIGGSVYRDTGCWAAPACLSCPLPVCVEDMTDHARAALSYANRNQAILEAWEHGEPTRDIASRTGLSHRQTLRILQEARG